MYELIINEFNNPEILFNELQRIKTLSTFISSFGTISFSNDIAKLEKLANILNSKIKTTIFKKTNTPSFKQEEIHTLAISLHSLIINSKFNIPFNKIISISIEPINTYFIKEVLYNSKSIKNIYTKDIFISLKLLTPNKIFWTSLQTKFFSNMDIFKINKAYNENIKNLLHILKLLNKNIKTSPLVQMYINSDNYIKYFISDTVTKKESLWMKKAQIINF